MALLTYSVKLLPREIHFEVGECGASWFVDQASRYLDDGSQTTSLVRVEHLTRRTTFDMWKWTKGCRWQRWQRPFEGHRPPWQRWQRSFAGQRSLGWTTGSHPPRRRGRSEPSNTHDYADGMRSALNAMGYEQDASEGCLVLESIPAHMQHRLFSTLIQSEWSVANQTGTRIRCPGRHCASPQRPLSSHRVRNENMRCPRHCPRSRVGLATPPFCPWES